MIELEKIEKIYNAGKATETHALKDINLRIEEGDMVAITGPSGSGKSTLLHIIAGIDSPSSGEYRFCGKLVSDMSEKDRDDHAGFWTSWKRYSSAECMSARSDRRTI